MRSAVEKGWFWRWGERMYRYRRTVALLWLMVFVAAAGFAGKAPDRMRTNGFTPEGSEAETGMLLLRDRLGVPASSLTVVFRRPGGDLTTPEAEADMKRAVEPLLDLPYVKQASVVQAARQAGADRGVAAMTVALDVDPDEAVGYYTELRGLIRAPEGTEVLLTGAPPVVYDMQQASKSDIGKAERIGLPLALIVLAAVFGTLTAALLPLAVGLVSVVTTLGLAYAAAGRMPLSGFLPNMVTMLGLAVGIDYALFMVSRFREELRRESRTAGEDSTGRRPRSKGPAVRRAVAATCQTAGHAIFFSGLAVLIGLAGMLWIRLNIFRSLFFGGAVVVLISVLAANTLLPALLGMLGERVNRLRIWPGSRTDGQGRLRSERFWERAAISVMRRPVRLAVSIAVVFLALALPAWHIRLDIPDAKVLPPIYDSRLGADLLEQTFDMSELRTIELAVRAPDDVWSAGAQQSLAGLRDEARGVAGVEAVRSYLDLAAGAARMQAAGQAAGGEALRPDAAQALGVPPPAGSPSAAPGAAPAAAAPQAVRDAAERLLLARGDTARLVVVPGGETDAGASSALIGRLRAMDEGGLQVYVTGGPAYNHDIVQRIRDHVGAVVACVTLATYLVLLAAFRSVVLPLKAVLMNALSLSASLGIVVAVFQYGFGAEALRITSTGYVNAVLPVIVFCVVFGISMDYEVFLLSRIAEEYDRTGDNERSTAVGLAKTGGLITSAAFILIVVVGSFLFTDIEIMKALGLGLATAVFLDATIIRILLVPALMKLLGRANWWAPKKWKPEGRP